MKRKNLSTLRKMLMLVAVFAVAAMFSVSANAQAVAGAPTTTVGIQPVLYPGNFVADTDDEVCYAICRLFEDCDVTGEMRGIKVDPPAPGTTTYGQLDITISANGQMLDWNTNGSGAQVLWFIIKGGRNFNLYTYVGVGGFPFPLDTGLHSPGSYNRRGQLVYPQISHFNACYIRGGGTGGDQGCTPGYWRNHYDRWVGLVAMADFDTTFGVDMFTPDATVGQVISAPNTYGSDAFHAVAALLNANAAELATDAPGYVAYPSTPGQVIGMVQVGNFGDLKRANELGCPLGGSPACSKANRGACVPLP
ncbi:MAG: hypothetical protein H0V76_02845 [Blastocatellia bacterium]|nr:hypothetical protein [Blastocatellia bacterium]